MNFLSHYYFERYSQDPELVLGSILPDLLKNADKDLKIHPDRFEHRLGSNPKLNSIYLGWKRHVEADRLFHNSQFFYNKTHDLKIMLSDAVANTQIRPSFLSHIALELLLDHLLLHNELVHETDFYEYLAASDRLAADNFLKLCEVQHTGFYFQFFNSFMRAQYVGSYRSFDQITQALINICRRLWDVQLSNANKQEITTALTAYAKELNKDFKNVFQEIQEQLTPRPIN